MLYHLDIEELGHVIINVDNGQTRYFLEPSRDKKLYESFLRQNDTSFYEKMESFEYSLEDYKTVFLSINITTNCNLRCRYCFADHAHPKNISLAEIKDCIRRFVFSNLTKKNIFVDLSGSGEPLTRLKDIVSIGDYCKELSNETGVNIVPQLITNGTLLNPKVTKLLQKHMVLFGVSIDGTKSNHDLNRCFQNGKPSYTIIEKNVKRIKNKQYVGAGMVIDGNFSGDVLQCYKNLLSLLPTVSVKFARSSSLYDFSTNKANIMNGYETLANYLTNQLLNNDFKMFFAIINGDDIFGTYLCRIFLDNIVYRRCDVFNGRKCLSFDGETSLCAPAIWLDQEEMRLFMSLKSNNMMSYCNKCHARYVCGGECPVVLAKIKQPNYNLCVVRRHLVDLGRKMRLELLNKNPIIENKVVNFCIEKELRWNDSIKRY